MVEVPGVHLTHPSQLEQLSISSIPPHSTMLLAPPAHFALILKNPLVVDVELQDVPPDPTVVQEQSLPALNCGHSTTFFALPNISTL